ncbi:hypothetical protein JOC24_005776 [Streptomyces sp. HB132]|nr:hypothetical protein [Streptomyces sp. HB132]
MTDPRAIRLSAAGPMSSSMVTDMAVTFGGCTHRPDRCG